MSKSASAPRKRSAVVAIVGIFIFFASIANIAFGALLVVSADLVTHYPDIIITLQEGDLSNWLDDPASAGVQGLLYLFLGIVQFVLAIGFWQTKRWAWIGIMSWQALKLLIDITNLLNGERPVLSVLFAIAVVFMLNQSDVRRVFGIIKPKDDSVSNSNPPIRAVERS